MIRMKKTKGKSNLNRIATSVLNCMIMHVVVSVIYVVIMYVVMYVVSTSLYQVQTQSIVILNSIHQFLR